MGTIPTRRWRCVPFDSSFGSWNHGKMKWKWTAAGRFPLWSTIHFNFTDEEQSRVYMCVFNDGLWCAVQSIFQQWRRICYFHLHSYTWTVSVISVLWAMATKGMRSIFVVEEFAWTNHLIHMKCGREDSGKMQIKHMLDIVAVCEFSVGYYVVWHCNYYHATANRVRWRWSSVNSFNECRLLAFRIICCLTNVCSLHLCSTASSSESGVNVCACM